jgi:ribose/xylose/arabinose/galactoside ABC-type transport system permease subunit
VTLAVIALGVTVALSAGAIDFAVAGNAALAGVVAGVVGRELGAEIGFLVGVGGGTLIGLSMGLVIQRFDLNPFLVTLAMAGTLRGVAFVLAGSSVGVFIDAGPTLALAQDDTFGVPDSLWLLMALAFLAWLFLARLPFGRSFLATGGNPQAARLVGIRSGGVLVAAYGISGTAAALGGLLLAGRAGVAIPQAGAGTELLVFSAVLLGGTALSGGRASIAGTLLGVLLINSLYTGLVLTRQSPYWQTILQGVFLIAAIVLVRMQAEGRHPVALVATAIRRRIDRT